MNPWMLFFNSPKNPFLFEFLFSLLNFMISFEEEVGIVKINKYLNKNNIIIFNIKFY
jgi:hypothetical protein